MIIHRSLLKHISIKVPFYVQAYYSPDGERPYSSWDPQQHLQDCPNCYETRKSLPGAYNPPLSLLIGYSCPLGGQRAIINCGLPHGTDEVSYHNIQRKHDLRICIIAHRKLFRLEAGPASHNPGWTDRAPVFVIIILISVMDEKCLRDLWLSTLDVTIISIGLFTCMAYRQFNNSHRTARLHTTHSPTLLQGTILVVHGQCWAILLLRWGYTYDELPRHHQIKFAICNLLFIYKRQDVRYCLAKLQRLRTDAPIGTKASADDNNNKSHSSMWHNEI